MILMIIVIAMVIVVAVIIVITVNMNLAVKVLGFSPDKCWSYGRLNGKGASVTQPPLEDATKETINRVVLWITIQIGVKSTVPFDGKDGREVKFASFKRFLPTTMGAVRLNRSNRRERAQKKSQKQKSRPKHEMKLKRFERLL
jgi:hypothetical protein